MNIEKSLGQIAYEVHTECAVSRSIPWDKLPDFAKDNNERIAQAIASHARKEALRDVLKFLYDRKAVHKYNTDIMALAGFITSELAK